MSTLGAGRDDLDNLAILDGVLVLRHEQLDAAMLSICTGSFHICCSQTTSTSTIVIVSINDMYKRLQEYNTSLQQYNSKLQTELNQTSEILKNVEREKAALTENLSNLRGYHASQQDQLTSTKANLEEANHSL